MKIYTRTGDAGSTGLFGGPRVGKDDCRIESYGTVDELNAVIGMVRSSGVSDEIDGQLDQIQHELFSIGAELATPNPEAFELRVIGQRHIDQLESWIDGHESKLAALKSFILPGGTVSASNLHLARSVCRRAERRVVTLSGGVATLNSDENTKSAVKGSDAENSVVKAQPISESLIIYLNRLSDYLFVVSRAVNQEAGVSEVEWQRPAN